MATLIRRSAQGRGVDDWARNIHEMLEEMHRRTYIPFRDCGTWQPATNVYEDELAYHVCVDLAGLAPEEVSVECADQHHLTIAGQRANPQPEGSQGNLSVHVMEIDEGPFRREMDLPLAVDTTQVEATYRKGFLWIRLPKAKT
jgi:HSP20 family protein